MRIILLSALLTASLFGQHRGGSSGGRGMRPSYPARSYYGGGVVAYPVVGGYYVPGYAYGYAEQAPVVLVNPDFQADGGTQTVIDYSNVPATTTEPDTTELKDDQPTVFLIALTDHTVLAAIAYWVDGDSLHWVSRDAKVNQLSLSLVDRQFSKQLNDERHVEFKLPAAN
jgi:hypothetical protein